VKLDEELKVKEEHSKLGGGSPYVPIFSDGPVVHLVWVF